MQINLRDALMTGKRLPYDAEVEYIRGTGTQYINTGIYQNPNTEYKVTVMPEASTNLTVGNFNGGGAYGFRLSFHAGGVFQDWYSSRISISAQSFNQIYTATVKRGSLRVQGPSIDQTATGTQSESTSTAPIYLLSAPNPPGAIGAAKLYSCKIWDNNVLVRDYIPVRKGTVGELYDRVSGKFAERHGDFVVGQDVVPVEYIESHGTEYINPQVSVASGNSFTLNMTGSFTGTSSAMQLHGVNGGAYFGLQTNGNYTVGGQDTGVARDSADHAFALSATIGNSQVVSLGIDGNTYTRTRNNSAGYIGLFNLLDATTGNPLAYYSKFRMKDASITVNSATVRIMKAIRVGTDATSWEGAMMDTLTRRIYRNAGTGAFTYGNDLKYPIPAS